MKIFYIFLFFLVISCSQTKTVLICGDHECINKKEAELYFNETLSLEVKITERKKKDKIYDLVKLNTTNSIEEDKIRIVKKEILKKKIRKLSKKEIEEKKREIKFKEKKEDIKLKKYVKADSKKKPKTKKEVQREQKLNNSVISEIKSGIKKNPSTVKLDDICSNLEKCDIDEITKYLTNLSKSKKFPKLSNSND